MGRRFERHLDLDLIAKIEAGQDPRQEPKGLKKVKEPRPAASYRAARRNTILRRERLTWNQHCYYRPRFKNR